MKMWEIVVPEYRQVKKVKNPSHLEHAHAHASKQKKKSREKYA